MHCLISFGFLGDEHETRRAGTGDRPVLGPLRYAHFEVEVDADGFPVGLGAGAMAVTYRAKDTILNSTVALKVIARKLAENPTARARFLQEARAAAQIQHPNVARVTHYGEQDGECFYAMELVHGETLEERVRRTGALPVDLALEIIEQIARGLAAAEACGVVHRDLKPSNVMIESDPSGHLIVKIIDYGVAQVIASQSDALGETQAGFVGTPAFASPEQFAENGELVIDVRSDIYALGVTLWYLLTGQTPFRGHSLEEIRARQSDGLPVEQLKSAYVPARVITLLTSMLAVDPANRPQTARELLAAVHRYYIRFDSRARLRRRRFAFAAIASLVALALIGVAKSWYQRERAAALSERSIAVLPFKNLSPIPEEAFFTIGMQDEIAVSLGRLADMKVIGTQSTRSYAADSPRNFQEIGRVLGVRHLLEGSVRRENGKAEIGLRLVDLRNNDHAWTQTYQGPIKDIFALQAEITRAIAEQLRTQLSDNETAALDLRPTSDLPAYDLYLQVLAIPGLVKDSAEQRRNAEKRVALLDAAIARDPRFVLAYCELAKAHDRLYRSKQRPVAEERSVDHRALADSALEKARRVQPDAGPVHLALADHLFSVVHDFEQARIELDLARRTLPNSAELESTAGTIARAQNRWDDAIRFFEKAVALEPKAPAYRFTLANTHRLMRHYADFERLMTEVIDQLPADDTGSYRIGRTFGPLEARADVEPMRSAVVSLKSNEDPEGRLRDFHNLILALWNHDPDSVSRISARADEATLVINRVKYPKSWYEGLAARMRGDKKGTQAAFAAARLEVEKAVLADASDGRALSLLAMIDAGLGKEEDAVREGHHACDLEPFETSAMDAPIVRCNLAVVYSWTDQPDLALAELDKLVSKPAGSNLPAQPTYGDLRLNPVWDPLRSNSRFVAIVRRLAPTQSK